MIRAWTRIVPVLALLTPAAAALAQAPAAQAPAAQRRAPAPPVDRVLTVTPEALVTDAATGLVAVSAVMPPPPAGPVQSGRPEGQLSRAERFLLQWQRRGLAAGNAGDLYDNRDRGHSQLLHGRFPTLTSTRYDPRLRERSFDYGLNDRLRFPAPTFGNSSTAQTGTALWRSQPRWAMTQAGAIPRIAALYNANHLYVYPEHRDHDPHRGDLFPAAVPYFIVSQGSSGSDRRILRAIATALAAFRPDVKAMLRDTGRLAAAVQMLIRRSMTGIETSEDYLSGHAHPSAFDPMALDIDRLIWQTHALDTDRLPPDARLRLVSAPDARPGVTLFQDGTGEGLFVTDHAIAWIAQSMADSWRFVLDAETDPQDARLHWRILRGDAKRIRIEHLAPNERRVAVTVPWHDPFPVPGHPEISTQRVDIALFAERDGVFSAPAFLSVTFPPNQRRRFDTAGRLVEIARDGAGAAPRYVDPLLYPEAGWTDRISRDASGQILGWIRVWPDGQRERFTRHGLLAIDEDGLGRVAMAVSVRYPVSRDSSGPRWRITPVATDQRWRYRYRDDADLLGEPEPVAD